MRWSSSQNRPALALLSVLLLAVLTLGWTGERSVAADWPPRSYVLQVNGLACPYCGYSVEKQFAKREGVVGTDIHIDEGVVVVEVAPETRFADDELARIIDAAGFELGAIVHRPQAP